MLVAIPVLEEALGIETLFPDNFGETAQNFLDHFLVGSSGRCAPIDGLSTGISEGLVQILLKVLLGEYFINGIAEFSPFNVVTGLRRLEVLTKLVELSI